MTIQEEYLDYQVKYGNLYGKDNTFVLMQVGGFHEAYSIEENGGFLKEISEITNLTLTRKNKNNDVIDIKNPYMMGFPLAAFQKYLKILMDNGFTVVVIDQIVKLTKIDRVVTGVYSPGTYIQDSMSPNANYLMSILIEDEVQLDGSILMCIGMSAIELSTGHSIIHEAIGLKDDEKYALDELHRFINNYKPKELIINRKDNTTNNPKYMTKDELLLYIELNSKAYHYNNSIPKEFSNLSYQNAFFKKIFKEASGLLSPIEHLDLEHMSYARISYMLLLDFSYKHNEKIIEYLNKPEIFQKNKYLILGNNAINQLNVFETETNGIVGTKFTSLFAVIDNTTTAIGKRYLRDALSNPLTNSNEINTRYSIINSLVTDNIYETIEEHSKSVMDIERLNRKMSLAILQPFEMAQLIWSLKECKWLIEYAKKIPTLKEFIPTDEDNGLLEEFLIDADKKYNMDELKKQNFVDLSTNFFTKEAFPEINELQDKIDNNLTFMNSFCEIFSKLIETPPKSASKSKNIKSVRGLMHLYQNNSDGYYISLTKQRSNSLRKKLDEMKNENITVVQITPTSSIEIDNIVFKDMSNGKITRITFPELNNKSDNTEELKENMTELIKETYHDILVKNTEKYMSMLKNISSFIGFLDFCKSGAKTAKIYNYCRPEIKTNIDNSAFINITDMRHPIVERIKKDVEYIPVSLCLGKDHNYNNKDGYDNEYIDGMLLYGVNSSGKSTSQKALGLCTILAQIGYYVPATSCAYSPYESIFARITGNDNIFKGLSSFVLEMTELRAILQRTTKKTLVIGDEVCRGTEYVSGNAIVAATIINLANTGAQFMFATHLHDLVELEDIKNLKNVKPYHLSIQYDAQNDVLIFDRQLKPGPGEKLYGLLVAKYIIRNPEFVKLAQHIKCQMLDEENRILTDKTSKYNSKVFMTECKICGKKPNPNNNVYLDTHHINQQKDCKFGFVIDKAHLPKNNESNLIVLCRNCHVNVHQDKIKINGYVETTNGRKLLTN